MKKILLFTSALLALVVLKERFNQPTKTTLLQASEVFAVDGDTLGHGSERFRLVGFDTPETFRAQCAEEHRLGQKAKRRLEEIILTAGHVQLEIQEHPDKYGRHLAVARAGGHEVGSILISEGLARPYQGGKRSPWCT